MAENLKVKIGADTSQFNAGMKDVRQGLKDLDSVGSGALASIGSALGLNVDQIKRLQSATVGALSKFGALGKDGASSVSNVTVAVAKLGAGIAGLGIAAAVAAFRELNKEAEYFEQRGFGVNLKTGMEAAGKAYSATLMEATGAGEKMAKTMESIRYKWTTGKANLLTGLFTGYSKEDMAEATRKAGEAANLASKRVDIQRDIDKSLVSQAQYQKEINEQLLIAKDRSKDKATRDAAQAEAVRLVNAKYDEQIALTERLRDNAEKMGALNGNTDAENKEIYQLNAQLLNTEAQRNQELTSMVRLENQIASASGTTAKNAKETEEATRLTLESALELAKAQQAQKELDTHNDAMMARAKSQLSGDIAAIDGSGLTAQAETLTIPALIKPEVDTEAAEMAIIDLSGIVESGVIGMSEAIGTLIGNLINGENAWGNFAEAGMAVVADMLSSLGQAFITTGAGVEATKLAIATGNGVAAMAAGAAMVALAAALKTTMSNAASNWGGATASSSVASSSYSSGSSLALGDISKSIEVKVTGTLTGEGSKLKAVLNNEDRRNSVTT